MNESVRPNPEYILKELAGEAGDVRSAVPEQWLAIATEVLWRKRLLLAATKELVDRGVPNAFALATVDVFVEKAQSQLTLRAKTCMRAGIGTAFAALLLMGLGVWLMPILTQNVFADLAPLTHAAKEGATQPSGSQAAAVIVSAIFRASTVSGFYIGAIVFLIFLSRAFLHEMIVIYQRRHALRFGRLAVYLRAEKITVSELEEAFNWNAEYRSAFMDIRADRILQPVLTKVVEAAAKSLTSVTSAVSKKAAAFADDAGD